MNLRRMFGGILFLAGIGFITISQSGITGFVIVEQLGERTGSTVGLGLIAIGAMLLLVRTGEESDLEQSVKEAVAHGVPKTEAIQLLHEVNDKVQSGDWVELRTITVRDTTHKPHEEWGYGTSLCRYWGPTQYSGVSGKQLEKLYDQGKIGKTHEVVRGSNVYHIGGKLSEGTLSLPPAGSKVLHRHWEIEQMYKRRKAA